MPLCRTMRRTNRARDNIPITDGHMGMPLTAYCGPSLERSMEWDGMGGPPYLLRQPIERIGEREPAFLYLR
jgi:hypothetical protein